MRLAEVRIQRKALQDNIEQLKFRLTKVAKARGGDMTTERPQSTIHCLLCSAAGEGKQGGPNTYGSV
ncbi:MAG: hypothetical protein ACRERE_19615 [Candidatus Entotheonellia bacterium]